MEKRNRRDETWKGKKAFQEYMMDYWRGANNDLKKLEVRFEEKLEEKSEEIETQDIGCINKLGEKIVKVRNDCDAKVKWMNERLKMLEWNRDRRIGEKWCETCKTEYNAEQRERRDSHRGRALGKK